MSLTFIKNPLPAHADRGYNLTMIAFTIFLGKRHPHLHSKAILAVYGSYKL